MRAALRLLRSPWVRTVFLLTALALALYAVTSQWAQVRAAVSGMSLWLLGGALAAALAYVVLTWLAWRSLLSDMGTFLPRGPAFRVFFVSQLGKYLPGGVWNILAAAELGADHQVPRRRSVSVMAVSVAMSTVTGLALAVGTMPFAPRQVASTYSWTLAMLPVLLLLLAPPLLNRLLGAALRLAGRPPLEGAVSWTGMLACAAWTLLAWTAAGLQVLLLAVGTGMEASASTLVLCTGGYALAWSVGFLVVLVPAGAGVREAVLALVLAGSLSGGGVVVVVLLSRVVLTVADVALGGLGLLAARTHRDHHRDYRGHGAGSP